METTSTEYKHIGIDTKGVARIGGTRSRVIDVAMETNAWGYSPKDICRQHPHLTLGQVHSALAFYYDHKEKLDAEIERRRHRADQLREETEDTELQERLRKAKERRQPETEA